MNTQGLIHIYCGDGKGKTTAAEGWRFAVPEVADKFISCNSSREAQPAN